MSEFDQKDGHKKWFANPDFNLAQCNVVPAEHRAGRTTTEKHTVDYDCLGQLIDPRSRRPDFACPEQHKVRPPSYDKKIGLVLQGGGALGSYQAGVYEASMPRPPGYHGGRKRGARNRDSIGKRDAYDRAMGLNRDRLAKDVLHEVMCEMLALAYKYHPSTGKKPDEDRFIRFLSNAGSFASKLIPFQTPQLATVKVGEDRENPFALRDGVTSGELAIELARMFLNEAMKFFLGRARGSKG